MGTTLILPLMGHYHEVCKLMWALENSRGKPWPSVTFISSSGNKTNHPLITEMMIRMYLWRAVLQPPAWNGAVCAASGQFGYFWIFKTPDDVVSAASPPDLLKGCGEILCSSFLLFRETRVLLKTELWLWRISLHSASQAPPKQRGFQIPRGFWQLLNLVHQAGKLNMSRDG